MSPLIYAMHRAPAAASRETRQSPVRSSCVHLTLEHDPNRKDRATNCVLSLGVMEQARAPSSQRIEHRPYISLGPGHGSRANNTPQTLRCLRRFVAGAIVAEEPVPADLARVGDVEAADDAEPLPERRQDNGTTAFPHPMQRGSRRARDRRLRQREPVASRARRRSAWTACSASYLPCRDEPQGRSRLRLGPCALSRGARSDTASRPHEMPGKASRPSPPQAAQAAPSVLHRYAGLRASSAG